MTLNQLNFPIITDFKNIFNEFVNEKKSENYLLNVLLILETACRSSETAFLVV